MTRRALFASIAGLFAAAKTALSERPRLRAGERIKVVFTACAAVDPYWVRPLNVPEYASLVPNVMGWLLFPIYNSSGLPVDRVGRLWEWRDSEGNWYTHLQIFDRPQVGRLLAATAELAALHPVRPGVRTGTSNAIFRRALTRSPKS